MFMKKEIALFLALVTLVSAAFTGCKQNAAVSETGQTSKSESESKTIVKSKEPITFTAITSYSVGGTKWGQDPISKKITEETGVTLELKYTVGDFNEKLGLLISSGEYPDMFLSVDNYQLQDLVEANVALPLDEYLATGGENIKAAFGDKIGAMKNENDGKTYGFNKDFGDIPPKKDWYVQVQYPVLEEAGFPKINTLDELADLLEAYKNKHKKYNNLDLIGILSPAGGVNADAIRHGINNVAMRTAGFQDDGEFYIDPKTYQATYAIRTPQTKAYLEWLNRMYLRGLFALDSFALDHPGVMSEVAKGNVLCVTEPGWALDETEKALRTVNKTPELCYAKIPIYINKEAAANSQVTNYDSLGTWKSIITSKCADPKRAFEFFDTMWSEKMQVLSWWGVEGDLYTIKDDKRVLKPETITSQQNDANFRQNTGVLLYDYWSMGSLVKDSTGQLIRPYLTTETIAQGYTEQDKKVLTAYKPTAITWADLWPDPKLSPWGFAWKLSLPKGDGADAQTRIKAEINSKYMLKMVQAKNPGEFDGIWNEFVTKCLEAGIEIREKEVTEAVRKRMKLWYNITVSD